MDITITASVIIAFCSLVFTIYREITVRRKAEGKEQAIIEAKLDMIANDVADVKKEVVSIRTDWMRDHESLIEIKRDVAAMWKRIDEFRLILNHSESFKAYTTNETGTM